MIALVLGGSFLVLIFFVIPPHVMQLNESWEFPIYLIGHSRIIAACFIGVGILLFLVCFFILFEQGEGSAFVDAPTTKLVSKGPYRYSRNPLYISYILILVGIFFFYGHVLLIFYTLIVFLVFHLFIFFFEEPGLRRRFGSTYEEYTIIVSRWFPIWPRIKKI